MLTRGADGSIAAYDARDGSQQGPWFDPAWTAVDATFTHDGRIVWVADEHNGSYGLVDCQVAGGRQPGPPPGRPPTASRSWTSARCPCWPTCGRPGMV